MLRPYVRNVMPRRLVICDLDGTLADSAPGIVASFNASLEAYGLSPQPAARLFRGAGTASKARARLQAPVGEESGSQRALPPL